MDVRDVVLGLAGWAGFGDRRILVDLGAPLDEQRAEVRQRHLAAVSCGDCDGQPVCRDLARERDLPGSRSAYDGGIAEGDVDAAVLAPGIRVLADRELPQDRSVRRPGPGRRIRRGDERPERDRERDQDRPRWPMRKHDARVVADPIGGNGFDEVVTETRGRARSARHR